MMAPIIKHQQKELIKFREIQFNYGITKVEKSDALLQLLEQLVGGLVLHHLIDLGLGKLILLGSEIGSFIL